MPFWFPDTTVLRNFAAIRQTAVLESVLNGKGRCVEAIDGEIFDASQIRGYEELASLRNRGVLGDPISIFDESHVSRVQEIRQDEVGGDAGDPLDSLGEAETLFIIREHEEFTGSLWLTDDWAAYDFGKRSGVTTLSTVDVVAVGVGCGVVPLKVGFMHLGLMGTRKRTLLFAPTSMASLQEKVDDWMSRELFPVAS